MAPRPTCRDCGKTLREVKESDWHSRTREAAEAIAAQHPGATIRQPYQGSYFIVEWPTGRYGYGGDDRFCTLRCGYRWAVRHAGRG